jgi:hypothetical protein
MPTKYGRDRAFRRSAKHYENWDSGNGGVGVRERCGLGDWDDVDGIARSD